ncbi:transcription initiation factor IID, 18kD subunit-domain-containing protein [Tricharina praecox]|uniref:transcription initiation factor IID, 18kD subunit-domain-containing protein n=1 Tax=Tricharina praecox TaxID=43433 RepID=UPI002220558F|nr:transcription initiation factor IID, 18kD subunit-domain-containing protein [Tricharina praecox]KAI5858671.1 transcription initiation factor IID, 18kD subunit-domain-containing protein [Tricharina praecox]
MAEKDKFKFRLEIQQMMFVSGETGEPSPETTGIIEEMVRGQVVEMLLQCTQLAARRGSRSISTDDLIFLIRHDKAKVSRLRTYLSWKDVRKTAREQDPVGGGAGAEPGDLMEEAAAGVGSSGPTAQVIKQKKTKVGLPWEVNSFFSETVPEREDDEDEDELEANQATLQRLKNADERTRGMTRDEYVHWSECRQASFTFRKGKRFREWAGFGTVTEAKPHDDIVDILGFLTFEIVQTLTEEALKVKEQEDAVAKQSMRTNKKRKREEFLFHAQEGRTPVEARHVTEAFRRLQTPKPKMRAMRNFSGGAVKSRLTLV